MKSFHLSEKRPSPEFTLRSLSQILTVAPSVRMLRCPADFCRYHNVLIQGRTQSRIPVNASGFSLHRSISILKALGEFIERYAVLSPPEPHLIKRGPSSAVSFPILDFQSMPLFTKDQLRQEKFRWRGYSCHEYEWLEVSSLVGGASIHVPVDLLHLHRASDISLFGSTGAAAHTSQADALISGILEIVERDALSIMWETQSLTPLISCTANFLTSSTLRTIALLERANQKVILRDITTDIGIPVVVAVILDQFGRAPCLVIGAGSALSHSEACLKALDEAAAVWIWMRDEHSKQKNSFEKVMHLACSGAEPMWQAVLYGFKEMLPAAKILTERAPTTKNIVVEKKINLSSAEYLDAITGYFSKSKIPLYYQSIMPSEFDGIGWYAIRAIAPSLVPLSFGNVCRPLGNPRLKRVPDICNWQRANDMANLPHYPVPLP